MTAVLDASAALGIAMNPDGLPALEAKLASARRVIAPELWAVQVLNGLWKAVRFGALARGMAEQYWLECREMIDELASDAGMLDAAYQLALETGRTVYDALYLILARREGATLVTLDEALASSARSLGIEVIGRAG